MTIKSLYQFLKQHRYSFSGVEWKQGNKKFNPYSLAQAVLPFCEAYDDTTQLLIDISKLEKEWNAIEADAKANKSERIASFIEAYTSYISSDDIVSPVDIAIWGQSCTAQRENEDKYYVKPTGVASEFEEVADDLGGIGKTFADEIVYSKKYGKIKRGKLFQLIFNQLIKDFPIDNPNFAKAKDLEHPCLSPVILKNFIELVTVKDKGEILGYKLVAKVTTTVQDYYTKSSGVVAGSMKDIGIIKPLSNKTEEPCLKYFDLDAICNTEDTEYGSWGNFMGQMRCKGAREVFMAWVYSVFYEKNHSPQCLWISDRGGLGKSTIIKALQHYTGKAMGTISDKTLTSDFGTETILGKRLVVNADCKKPSVIHSELLHCLTPNTEVLTPSGWVKISELGDQKVAQYDLDTMQLSFVSDYSKFSREVDEEIYTFTNGKYYHQQVTKHHRMVYRVTESNLKTNGSNKVELAESLCFSSGKSPVLSGSLIPRKEAGSGLSYFERLLIALQADGLSKASNKRFIDSTYCMRLAKPRKIDRLEYLLDNLRSDGVGYTKNKLSYLTKGGLDVYDFSIKIPKDMMIDIDHKLLSSWTSFDQSLDYFDDYLEECAIWDGYRHVVDHKFGRIIYTSTVEENARTIQTIAHLCGKRANFHAKERKNCVNSRILYTVTISDTDVRTGQPAHIGKGTQVQKIKSHYVGKVYCLSVPSTAFLIRSEGMISVTGNCISTHDPQIINRKHKSQFTGNIYSKVLICSNHAPNLHTSELNQMRRIIYIKMTAPTQEEMIAQGRIKIVDGQVVNTANVDRFLQQLIAEFPAFMKDARACYEELCQNDNEIHLCPEMKAELEALNDTTVSILSDVLDATIKVVPLAEAIASKTPLLDIVTMRDTIAMELGRDLNDSDNFRIRDLLNNLHGLDNLNNKVRVNDKLVRCITGQEQGIITVAVKK